MCIQQTQYSKLYSEFGHLHYARSVHTKAALHEINKVKYKSI